MLEDFERALARVQSDYGFYIACQTDPATALAEYELDADELSALTDSDALARVLRAGTPNRMPSITIKISGTHDWINPSRRMSPSETAAREGELAGAVERIRASASRDERRGAALRLVELLG